MKNLFVVGKPVSGDLFYDREELLESIISNGNNYALIGIRRVGKTSILNELAERYKKKGVIAVKLDVTGVSPLNMENFLRAYTIAATEAYAEVSREKIILEKLKQFLSGKWEDFTKYLKTARLAVKDVIEIWFEYYQKEEKDLTQLTKEVLSYPDRLAQSTGKTAIVLLDEFQELQKLGDFLWALRSNMQKTRNVSYIISGSAVGTTSYMPGNKKSPFYGMFSYKRIEGIDEKSARKLLGRLNRLNIVLEREVEEEIIKRTERLPMYLQAFGKAALSYSIGELVSKGRAVIKREGLKQCWKILFDELYFHFEELYGKLRGNSKLIMQAIATKGIHRPAEIAKETGIKLTSLPRYLDVLTAEGFLKKENGYDFTDPLLKEWLAQKVL